MAATKEKPLCAPRRRFKSAETARAAVDMIYRRTHESKTVSPRCKFCGGWHLS
jgi:hypothetical protein